MCGIAGLIHFDDRPLDGRLLESMTRSLAHRGPDGEGYVLLGGAEKPFAVRGPLSAALPSGRIASGRYAVGMGHRRLAIVDLTVLGHQPMGTDDGYWITYNGAVCNAPELRQELRLLGHEFRSATDTEVVLASYRQWGAGCLPRLNGMFAFAIWDPVEETVFCARDRFGIKPFYYRSDGTRFLFASEIKALLRDPHYRPVPNETAVYDYLTQGWHDHTTDTFFSGIQQLAPGACLTVVTRAPSRARGIVPTRWWEPDIAPLAHDRGRASDELRHLLEDSVRLQLRADVPIGSCLSGGLDSSTIVCTAAGLMGRDAAAALRTFSFCADGVADERPYIREVLARTGVRNDQVMASGSTLKAWLPLIVQQQDEPFAGTSVIGQWTVMRAAGDAGIKVVLDGQGADELFLGYPRYLGFRLADLMRSGQWLAAGREWRAWRRLHDHVPETALAGLVRGLLPGSLAQWARTRVMRQETWLAPSFARTWQDHAVPPGPLSLEQQRLRSLTQDLPALLHYEDRNAMAFSIEARVPYLDHRLVEWALRQPTAWQLADGRTKALLRDALKGRLPEPVRLRRDKVGFATPEDHWLRRVLHEEITEVLESDTFRSRPYWRAGRLQDLYRAYCGGAAIGPTVWRWVNLEWWLRRFCD
jgi:asparagine synthase (glutamine-hydrolysing)